MIRSQHELRELNIDTVRSDAQYDMTRHDANRERGQQYNTYMYGKPRTVHTICSSYCISSGRRTVRYEPQECRLQTERFYLRSARFSSRPWGLSRYDLQFALYFLGAKSDRSSNVTVTNRSRPNLILNYGTGCRSKCQWHENDTGNLVDLLNN
jgi:hypothetical protein